MSATIETSPPASYLSPELERALRGRATLRHVGRKQALYTQRSKPTAIFCVEKGLIRLSVTGAGGREAVLNTMKPGHWFGELSMFIHTPRGHDALALEDTDLLVVSESDFREVVDQRADFLLELIQMICWRYKLALQRMDASALLPLQSRVADRLVQALKGQRTLCNDAQTLQLSQESLAHMLGVARQSVNRQLKELEQQGLIRLQYGRITILDDARLRRLAEGREG